MQKGQAERSISCRSGTVQAAADPVRRMPEPGQSRYGRIALPSACPAIRERGVKEADDGTFSHFSAVHCTHGLADTMTKNYQKIFV